MSDEVDETFWADLYSHESLENMIDFEEALLCMCEDLCDCPGSPDRDDYVL